MVRSDHVGVEVLHCGLLLRLVLGLKVGDCRNMAWIRMSLRGIIIK